MARKFLTHLDMQGNQILNAALQKLTADPTTGNFEGRMYYNTTSGTIRYYDGAAWNTVGESITISGTENEIVVSVDGNAYTISLPSTINADTTGNAATASKLSTARDISLTGDVTGTASFDGSSNVSISASIAANSVALGTDTTGDYVATIAGTTNQVTVSGTGTEGRAVTLSTPQDIHTGANPTFAGATLGNVKVGITADGEIDTTTGNLTLDSAGGTTTVDDNLVVTGDLTVQGTTTTIDTQTLNVEDNIITLNYGVTGTPTLNSGIEVERGDLANVQLRWNETNDVWEATTNGTNYFKILLSSQAVASDINDFTEAAQDAVGGILTDTNTIDFTYTDGTPSITADVKLAASNSYLSSTSGLAVDISSVEAKLVTDRFAKKMAANVGNASATTFVVTHNLGTSDVNVQVWSNDTASRELVETDVQVGEFSGGTMINTTTKITVSFATAPATDAYRVVVIG